MDPTQPIKDGTANSDGYFQWPNYGANLGTPNPVEQLMAADNKSTVKRLIANAQFNYRLPFLPELQANLNVAKDQLSAKATISVLPLRLQHLQHRFGVE